MQQLARRLLVNILLGNGNAHLKNWSLVYPDQVTPRLAPAYDLVTTAAYLDDEETFALNLGGGKHWYQASVDSFRTWAKRVGVRWRAVQPHLDDVMSKARNLWSDALKDLPMNDSQKTKLQRHWARLGKDFRI